VRSELNSSVRANPKRSVSQILYPAGGEFPDIITAAQLDLFQGIDQKIESRKDWLKVMNGHGYEITPL
jgi:hypothetical protein